MSRGVESVGKVIFRKFAVNKIDYLRIEKSPSLGFFYRLVRQEKFRIAHSFQVRYYIL